MKLVIKGVCRGISQAEGQADKFDSNVAKIQIASDAGIFPIRVSTEEARDFRFGQTYQITIEETDDE